MNTPFYSAALSKAASTACPDDQNFNEESDTFLDCEYFKGHIKSTYLSGFSIYEVHLDIKEKFCLPISQAYPMLKMHFELEGDFRFESSADPLISIDIAEAHHQLFYLPKVEGLLTHTKSRVALELHLSSEFLDTLFKGDTEPLGNFGKAVKHKQAALLYPRPLPVTFKMRTLIKDICQCPFKGRLKDAYLSCKASELLLLQIAQAQDLSAGNAQAVNTYCKRIYHVKKLIEQNIEKPKTIAELSAVAGINECSLKKEFKREFGDTVFGYLTKVRLEQAQRLIMAGQSIKEVSLKTGYRHPQHFTAAFKRYYGYLPSKLLP